jgi:hypothetical protein
MYFTIIVILSLFILLYAITYFRDLIKPLKNEKDSFLFLNSQPAGTFGDKLIYLIICTFKVWLSLGLSLGIFIVGTNEINFVSDNISLFFIVIFYIIGIFYPIILFIKVSKF